MASHNNVKVSRRGFIASSAAAVLASQVPLDSLSLLGFTGQQQTDASLQRRREYLATMQRLLGDSARTPSGRRLTGAGERTWNEWQARTGELPPDFHAMRSWALIPDPLTLLDDANPIPIRSRAQWEQQRRIIKERFQHWVLGTMPPPPDNLRAVELEKGTEGDATWYRMRLEFGPEHRATLGVQLFVPGGNGPFPVLLTNHQSGRPWVNTAVARGYIGCIFQAIDRSYGLTDDSEAWQALYRDYDFGAIARWAWGGMRAVDYLVTLPFVDPKRIAIGGHSRNAKSMMVAAAFDDRIGAVVGSRGNTGEAVPWRYTEEMYVSESMQELTNGIPYWFHPRLRFFVGREQKLPVEQNLLLSLVAPRGLLLSHAFMEHQGNPMAIEKSYRSVRKVYKWMGQEQNIGLYQQPGEHPSSAEDVERYLDFFDTVFGRQKFERPEIIVNGYDYDEWLARSRERINPQLHPQRTPGDFARAPGFNPQGWDAQRESIRERMEWLMGEPPSLLPYPAGRGAGNRMSTEGWRGQLFDRPGAGYNARRIHFGDDLEAFMYAPITASDATAPADTTGQRAAPPDTARGPQQQQAQGSTNNQGSANSQRQRVPAPVVIWLHPFSYATGYSRYAYWHVLNERGFAVLAFDQIGFGTRADYPARFYQRHPRWSLMGKMIADTRAAIDAVVDDDDRYDRNRIFLQGYALGAKIALITAALDDRVAGVSASCGFTPLRLVRGDDGTEGLHHYSHVHGLLPRLGAFVGHEERVPVDFDEIIAAIAPRPVHLMAPQLDRHAPIANVRRAVDAARLAYSMLGRQAALELSTPDDFNRYPSVWMPQVDWVTRAAGLEIPTQKPR